MTRYPTRVAPALVALAALSIGAPRAEAQRAFAGSVSYRVSVRAPTTAVDGARDTALGATTTQTLRLVQRGRGRRVRADAFTPDGAPVPLWVLTDLATGTTTLLHAKERAAEVVDARGGDAFAPGVAAVDSALATLRPTGRRETIAGTACAVHVAARPVLGVTELCIATGAGTLLGPFQAAEATRDPHVHAIVLRYLRRSPGGFLPLRWRAVGGDGSVVEGIATRVERGAVAAALFAVPAGWRRIVPPPASR